MFSSAGWYLIERDIGLPLSKEIRRRSRAQTKTLAPEAQVSSTVEADTSVKTTEDVVKPVENAHIASEVVSSAWFEKLLSKCGECQTLKQLLDGNLN